LGPWKLSQYCKKLTTGGITQDSAEKSSDSLLETVNFRTRS